ncbi:unnamed protein product [Caenorhabditis angaria]|uniref:Uncharacterized protein n=1 Tax=Caenorhabditis angaria TaxID=860376 RepID=A0A9P1N648_9PELO|nr:unnamed protein product [Caenorhabditis angaria]
MTKYAKHIHYFCTVSLYIIFILCIFMNFYVLLSREDTIYYLRMYDCVVALLMLTCGVVQIEFLIRTKHLPKLDEPHAIPDPALIGAIALTIGIMLGYLYFIVFQYAFASCDKLVDALYPSERYLEAFYDLLMAAFSGISLIYILHRRYYGAIGTNLDKVARLFVNITFSVVWMNVVIFKGYLSHQELCQRKELEGYWCPVTKRHYECDPYTELHGTQKMWYYINKGLLNSSIISCASEFFPVLLVTHWLACGGAEERAENIEKRMKRKEGVRGMMREFMKDVSRVYVDHYESQNAPLKIAKIVEVFFWIVTPVVMFLSVLKYLFYFYYTLDFDALVAEHYLVNDYINLAANIVQIIFFSGLYGFTLTIKNERLDAHHKAHSRGDISILFGCCIVLLIKLILQSIEIEYQRLDGFIILSDAIIQNISLVVVQITQWLQYFLIRRLLPLSDADCKATKKFLPLAAIAGLLMAWVHFGVTFFETSLLKYQLTDENFHFSSTTLICMIFTQTLFPADYLFAFTVSGCYLEFLQRYLNMGYFQLGEPRIIKEHHHNKHGEAHKEEPSNQDKIASMIYAASVLHRKRFETSATSSSEESMNKKF